MPDVIDISDAGVVLKPSFQPRPNTNKKNKSNNRRPFRRPAQSGGAADRANHSEQPKKPDEEKKRRSSGRNRSRYDDRARSQGKRRMVQTLAEAANKPLVVSQGKKETLRIIPLGGSGETGDKNMLIFEYDNDIIVIDAGVKFPTPDMPGIDAVICDITYLEQNRDRVRAFIVTHGHEDHIGGFPYIWPRLGVPIYTAPLTAGFIKAKFEEFGIEGAEFRIIQPNQKFRIGAFDIEPVRMTHSIPDILGLAFRTPVGLVYHATDWKFDFTPAFGEATDFPKLEELAKEGVFCLLSDSTKVLESGYTMSEQVVGQTMESIFEQAKGRIIVTSFASRIDRIQYVIRACAKTGRKLAVSGRSMERNINIALNLGYLKVPKDLLVDIRTINSLPDDKVVVISTGSQGEENSQVYKMASGEHRHIRIRKGDTVVFSSSTVPGNEGSVEQTINNLYREGAEVITNKDLDIHSSGHANREEVKLLLSILKPQYLIPIHGDYRRFVEHCKIGVETGMEEGHCLIIENGQVAEFNKDGGKVTDEKVPAGQVLIDGIGVGDIGEIVLRDRQTMAQDGVFLVILTVDGRTGKLLSSPDIISRGFVYMKESEELINGARALARRLHYGATGKSPFNWESFKKNLRDEMGNYLYEKTQRRPMVISAVIQV